MGRWAKPILGVSFACGSLALLAGSAFADNPAKPPAIPKAVPAPPGSMPALPTAVIDDTLQLGGENIDAKKVRSRMTIAVQVNGTGPYRFIVDSGADSSVVGRKVATALGLPLGTPVRLNGMTASSIVPRVMVNELTLGATSVYDLELPVLEERDLGGDGMLGIDALAGERLMLDFEKREITVEDASKPAKWTGDFIIVTARRHRGQLILTEVRANGQKVDAVVDTGTEITIGNMALRDKILSKRAAVIETIEVTGVTGKTVKLDLLRVGEIKLGSVTLTNVPIAFADVPPFGVFGLKDEPALLLGTDLMENFRRVSLDFKSRKVRFQLRKCKTQGIKLSTSFSASLITNFKPGNEAACVR